MIKSKTKVSFREAALPEAVSMALGILPEDKFENSRFERIEKKLAENHGHVFCPVCNSIFVAFRDGGAGDKKRKNARCPECGSLERHRLLWLHFINNVWPLLPKGKKDILHVAPEKFFVENLKDHPEINYISGDLMMPEAMIRLDLTDMIFQDGKLDVIICSHILEHIPDDRKAMREMYRCLKSGGFLLVMVPTYSNHTYEDFNITEPKDRKIHFGQEDHVRKYGEDIVQRLESSGFDVLRWPTPNNPSQAIIDFIASPRRIIFTCRKL
jgi:hypothetical protein